MARLSEGGNDSLHTLLFQKTSGAYCLALWLEVPAWDANSKTELITAPLSVSLQTPGNAFQRAVVHTLDDDGAPASSDLPKDGKLSVSDRVSVVELAH